MNHVLVRTSASFNHITVINVNTILPADPTIYNIKGKLNGRGLAELWKFVDKAIQNADNSEAALPKRDLLKLDLQKPIKKITQLVNQE